MKKTCIVTGAAGHLAGTLIRYLSRLGYTIRALVLPGEAREPRPNTEYFEGDVTKPETLTELFDCEGDLTVFHVAGIISIAREVSPALYEVNVNGTRNIIAKCLERGGTRLVYVSSVHAIPEAPDRAVISETREFSPESVEGAYAKTKAEASEAVIEACREGLDAVIVHPSGIIGPFDDGHNHLVQLVRDYIMGRLPAGVRGGYDLVDVRDVAIGCVLAAERGRSGETYILSNRYCTIRELFDYIRLTVHGHYKLCLPVWAAKAAAPFIEGFGKLTHKRPLFTSYSLKALAGNSLFSHDKATAELGFRPRDVKVSVADTVAWILSRKKRA